MWFLVGVVVGCLLSGAWRDWREDKTLLLCGGCKERIQGYALSSEALEMLALHAHIEECPYLNN